MKAKCTKIFIAFIFKIFQDDIDKTKMKEKKKTMHKDTKSIE